MFADKQWFVDQAAPQFETVPVGDREICVKSLDFLERSTCSAKASKACTVNDKLDTEQFSIVNSLLLMAASIVDENGQRIFTDSDADLDILRHIRARAAAPIDKAIQLLSFPDQPAESPLKN